MCACLETRQMGAVKRTQDSSLMPVCGVTSPWSVFLGFLRTMSSGGRSKDDERLLNQEPDTRLHSLEIGPDSSACKAICFLDDRSSDPV